MLIHILPVIYLCFTCFFLQVVFNVNNGAGRVSVQSVGRMLCDGQWHQLLARKTKHTLSLSIDGQSYTTHNPYPQSTSAETNNPVFLGGYPGEKLMLKSSVSY